MSENTPLEQMFIVMSFCVCGQIDGELETSYDYKPLYSVSSVARQVPFLRVGKC